MEIVPAVLSDVDRIADLEHEHGNGKPLLPSSIETAVESDDAEVLIAVADDGETAGHIIVNAKGLGVSIVVDPQYRGAGIAARLLEASEMEYVRVPTDNEARDALHQAGYEQVGEETAGDERLLVYGTSDQGN